MRAYLKDRRAQLAVALALLTPTPAFAVSVECTFETECFEAESCDSANFTLKLEAGSTPDTARLRSPSETVEGRVGGDEIGSLYWIGETDSAVQLLTWGADGSARYSVHLTEGPVAITYHGSCEAK